MSNKPLLPMHFQSNLPPTNTRKDLLLWVYDLGFGLSSDSTVAGAAVVRDLCNNPRLGS